MIGTRSPLPETWLARPATVSVIPGDSFSVVAATELKSLGPARPATSGVFPFGFGRQSKARSGTAGLMCHFRNNAAGIDSTEKSVGTCDIMPRYVLHGPAVAAKV